MLVLARKNQEKIVIGHDIVVQVLRLERETVKLGIQAPVSIPVYRQEIYEEIQRSNQAALRKRNSHPPRLAEQKPPEPA